MRQESTLIFTGDIGFDHYMDKKWEDKGLLSKEVLSFLASGDHRIVNVEGPLCPKKTITKENGVQALIHSMDPAAGDFLTRINADVWNICNNHIMDAGPEGVESTINEAKQRNASTLGAGMNIHEAMKPVIFDEAGGIGLIGVGYQRACRKATEEMAGCFSWSDLENIQNVIDDVKSKCRWCIIVAHAGEEFTALPSPYTRDRYHKYLEMGADIVIAHHPHVPMNYETVGDKVIFYSLGNFVFDTDYQRSQFNTEKGILIKLKFTDESFSFEPFGILINRNTEQIEQAEVPSIFVDVNAQEYEKLKALAAKMFIKNTKRQWTYLKPDIFKNATEEDWYQNFYEPLRSGRVPGECLDFQIIYPLSLEADKEEWKSSNLESVKNFILEQL